MDFAMTRILAEQQAKELVKLGYFGDLRSNPVLQAIAAHIMQNPPPNLPALTDMYLQSLEADLRDGMESSQIGQDERLDPLKSENRRLGTMLENLRLQKNISDTQREIAKEQAEIQALMSLPNPASMALAQQQQQQGAPLGGEPMGPPEMQGAPPMAQPPMEAAAPPPPPQSAQGVGPTEAAAM